jgi:hypothetical protein
MKEEEKKTVTEEIRKQQSTLPTLHISHGKPWKKK